MKKRTLLRALACFVVAADHRVGLAQHYPERPIRLFVGYAPGGQTDQIARLVADSLTKLLQVAVVVENRPGANGAIAVEATRRATPDGYTFVVAGNGTLTLTPLIQDGTNYDALRDFIPIARVSHVPLVLAVRSDLPIRNVAQLLDLARRQPGAVSCAVSGSATRMAIEFLNATAGVDLMIVPYKGNAPAIFDVVAGRADFVIVDIASVRSHVQAGTLRLIANAGRSRGQLANLPTMIEQGVKDFVCENWQGILAPAATPPPIIARIAAALRATQARSEFQDELRHLGFEAIIEGPDEFTEALREEAIRSRKLVALTRRSTGS